MNFSREKTSHNVKGHKCRKYPKTFRMSRDLHAQGLKIQGRGFLRFFKKFIMGGGHGFKQNSEVGTHFFSFVFYGIFMNNFS